MIRPVPHSIVATVGVLGLVVILGIIAVTLYRGPPRPAETLHWIAPGLDLEHGIQRHAPKG